MEQSPSWEAKWIIRSSSYFSDLSQNSFKSILNITFRYKYVFEYQRTVDFIKRLTPVQKMLCSIIRRKFADLGYYARGFR